MSRSGAAVESRNDGIADAAPPSDLGRRAEARPARPARHDWSPARPVSPLLTLGDVFVGMPAVQAALSGYSDGPMRRIARRHGASYTLCEVMLDQFLVALKDRQKTSHVLAIADEEHPVGGQLMGAEPEQFAAGAARLVRAGFDVIDINFGCPVKKVLGRCRGGFHLSQPDVALEIVARTRDVVPSGTPLTVKMRRGLDDSRQSRDNFYTILDGAFALGVDAVTVHGRTVMQRYVGPSDWDALRDVKRHVGGRTILGSGDLFTAGDVLAMLDHTGIDGVTVARGAIGNPWIFGEVRALLAGLPLPDPPTVLEQRAVLAEHYSLAEAMYGPKKAPVLMRKFAIKYGHRHPDPAAIRRAFCRIRDREQFQAVLAEHYSDDGPGRHVTAADHGIDTEATADGGWACGAG